MRSSAAGRPLAALLAALLAAAAAGGCVTGNYSNEDLEFMSALPERGDVVVEVLRAEGYDPVLAGG